MRLPVVGVGASAGGLSSIEAFFEKMPLDTGMSFVIVQHLSPDFKSLMTEILGRQTGLPVSLVTDDLRLEPDHIYVIPPGKEMRCKEHRLIVSDLPEGLHRPIDTFFLSMAENDQISKVAIVLSGTGSDGSEGVMAVHRADGLTIAESPETAEFDGMPVSAVRTNCVDLVLPPDEMPAALTRYCSQEMRKDELLDETAVSGIRLIFSLLEDRHGLHFDEYRSSTISRRIHRRVVSGWVSRHLWLMRNN